MNIQGKLPILVLGGTGQLGCLITKELLKNPEFTVSLLARDPVKCQDVKSKIEQSGGRIITADVTDSKSIDDVTKGINTVISALEGDASILIDGQLNILRDGIKNDIKRFVPSVYSVNFWNLPENTNYCADLKLKFRKLLEKEKVKGLYFTTGVFMETFFSIVEKEGFWYWGDSNRQIDLTSMIDVAKFVVEALKDPELCGDVSIYGVRESISNIQQIYNQVTGNKTELINKGNLNQLKDLIKTKKQEGNMREALILGFYYLLFGENILIQNRMNDKFPNVKVTSLEEYLDKTKGKPVVNTPWFDVAKNIPKETLLQYSV